MQFNIHAIPRYIKSVLNTLLYFSIVSWFVNEGLAGAGVGSDSIFFVEMIIGSLILSIQAIRLNNLTYSETEHDFRLGSVYAAIMQFLLILVLFIPPLNIFRDFTEFSFGDSLHFANWMFPFIYLTALITVVATLYAMNQQASQAVFNYIFLIHILLIIFFSTQYTIILYIAFEAVVVPLVLFIGNFGSRERRLHAAIQFFFFTLIGSIPMLGVFIYLAIFHGIIHFNEFFNMTLSTTEEYTLWIALMFTVSVKIPLVPLHIWLPEAHVEAPTIASVILAAVILKLGGFVMLRIILPFFPHATASFRIYFAIFCIIGMIYAIFTALRQVDIKKIIAYSSIIHMAYATVGLLYPNEVMINSSIVNMLNHGFISGGLFFAVGCLYERYHSRNLQDYHNLVTFFPELAVVIFLLTLANVAFPGTANFLPELGIFVGSFTVSELMPIFFSLALILAPIVNIWLATRLLYGQADSNSRILQSSNLTLPEKIIFGILLTHIFIIGCIPEVITHYTEPYVKTLVMINSTL